MITIKINTGNAAFEDNPDELKMILRDLAARVLRDGMVIRDSNGNTVGKVTLTGKDK